MEANFPFAQGVQFNAPKACEYVPVSQGWQAKSPLCPGSGEYRPLSHKIHVDIAVAPGI
jgi:hypothetical protein